MPFNNRTSGHQPAAIVDLTGRQRLLASRYTGRCRAPCSSTGATRMSRPSSHWSSIERAAGVGSSSTSGRTGPIVPSRSARSDQERADRSSRWSHPRETRSGWPRVMEPHVRGDELTEVVHERFEAQLTGACDLLDPERDGARVAEVDDVAEPTAVRHDRVRLARRVGDEQATRQRRVVRRISGGMKKDTKRMEAELTTGFSSGHCPWRAAARCPGGGT